MKKAMLSQPMAGKSVKQIRDQKQKAVAVLTGMDYEVINTYFDDEWSNPENMESRGVVNIPLAFMAKSLEHMSLCDAVYFCDGWQNARGCKIEHDVAAAYGLQIFYEEGAEQ